MITQKYFARIIVTSIMILSLLIACSSASGSSSETDDPSSTTREAKNLIPNEWTNGNLPQENSVQWFKFTATDTTHYVHYESSSIPYMVIILYDKSEKQIGEEGILANQVPKCYSSLIAGETYYLKITNFLYGGTGDYRIALSSSSVTPNTPEETETILEAMKEAKLLTINTWSNGTITEAEAENWYKFTATATTHHVHFKKGTLSSVYIQLYDGDAKRIGDQERLDTIPSTRYDSLTTGEIYYIKTTSGSSTATGTYQTGFTEISGAPGTLEGIAGATALTLDTWADGESTATTTEQWYKFTATAATHHVHFKEGTLSDVYILLHNSEGNTIGDRHSLGDYSSPTQYDSLTTGDTYYIKVTPYYIDQTGTYQIGFTVISGAPGTLEGIAGATALTLDTWADGESTATTTEQWYKFTATATTHHVHFKEGTLSNVYVLLHNSEGNTIGDRDDLGSYYSSTQYDSLTTGDTYYIKVTPYSIDETGTCQIGFTEISGSPDIVLGISGASALTLDTWADGEITTTHGEQWFSFTATATTHHVHFKEDTHSSISSINVQLYDSDGKKSGFHERYLDDDPTSTQYGSLTTGDTYYIKVTTNRGTYQIGFTEISGAPGTLEGIAGATGLTINTWSDGEITTTTTEQWFSFTATATTQHVHFKEGTLDWLDIQLYDLEGNTIGDREELNNHTYSNNSSTQYDSLTTGVTYYIKATLHYNSHTGTYQIGFNDSDVAPAE